MNEFSVTKKNSTETFASSRGYCSGSEQINEEEERLRQLFISCDSNHDGKLNRNDIICMCQRLNMEEYSDEIIKVLGANSPGAEITFAEFLRCRSQIQRLSRQPNISNVQNHNSPEYLVHSPYYSHPNQEYIGSCSDISAIYSSVDCEIPGKNESINNSLEEPLSLHVMLQQSQPDLYRRWVASEHEKSTNNTETLSQQLLNYANKIHLARINRMITELKVSARRFSQTNESRQLCQKEITRLQKEKERLTAELSSQSSRYEDRLTELHGVIGEWQKKFQHSDPYNRSNNSQIYNSSNTGNNSLIAQHTTIFEEDEDNNTNYDSSFFSHLINNNTTDHNNNNKNNNNTGDYEKLDLSRTHNSWSNIMETSGIYSQKEYPINSNSSSNPTNIPTITQSTTCTQTEITTCLQQQPQLQSVSLQHNDNKDDTADPSQYYEHDSAKFHIQEQLSGYESMVRTLRSQLSSVMDEKDSLKRQLKELQESIVQDQQHSTNSTTSNYHSQSISNCGSLLIGNSKMSLDSKSTTSSSSSPARPIMGIRHQNKQLQHKLQTNQEPEWVIRAVGKYNQINGALLTQSDSSLNSNSNNLNSNNQLNNPYFLNGAHQLLQELADNTPYPSMLEPLRRIVLEWQKYIAIQDRESADKLLLQHTLSESKALSDQLTCWVAQLQSDVSALSKSNSYADQIIELLDVLLQFREMETTMYSNNKNNHPHFSIQQSSHNPLSVQDNSQPQHITSSNQSITDSIYYQNPYSSLIPHSANIPCGTHHSTDSEKLRQGYREQVETTAKLLLGRLEDGLMGLSLNCGGINNAGLHTGRQTPDSGAGISSTMSSGSVDVEALLRNGGNSSSNIGSGLISPSNYQTGSPSTQSANSPNLQFPTSHSTSIPTNNNNNSYHTKSSSTQHPATTDLSSIESRIKRALEIISKQRNQTRKSIVTSQTTTTINTTAHSASISTTSNASVITNVTPNNNLTQNNSVNRNPSILHYNNNHSSYHQYSSNSQSSSLHRNMPLRSQEPDLISVASGQYSIEYTILLQEICSLKEERANLQTRLYLLQKDVHALQLTIDSKSANEKAMKLQLALTSTNQQSDKSAIHSNDESLINSIIELRNENTLNQTKTNQLITDLQLANSALITAFDKAKRKYSSRITRLENQLDSLNSNTNNAHNLNNHNENKSEETAL